MSRPTITDRRRAMLARRVAALEAMEQRAMITESLGIMTLGIGIPAALAAVHPKVAEHAAAPARRPLSLSLSPVSAAIPRHRPPEAGWLTRRELPVVAARSVASTAAGDWLTLRRQTPKAPAAPEHAGLAPPRPPTPAPMLAGGTSVGGGSGPGGIPGGGTGAIAPLQLPPPSFVDGGGSTATAAAAHVASTGASVSPANSSSSTVVGPALGSGSFSFASASSGTSKPPQPIIHHIRNNSSPVALGQFTNFPLYTLDYPDGTVMFPGVYQYATLDAWADLRAQVRDTTVSSYSWDTTNLTDATSITGTSTYRLQFQWAHYIAAARTDSVTLTVTNNSNQTEVQTYTFALPAGNVTHNSGGAPTITWPEALSPDTVLPAAPSFDSHNVSVDANGGALDANIPLPAYNPNIAGLALTYVIPAETLAA
jgi:hypothetical protein